MKATTGSRYRFGTGSRGKPHAPGVRLGDAPSRDSCQHKAYADGGWIKGAISKPGALHESLGVPQGEKIPAKKLDKAAHSSNPTLKKRAVLAKTLKGMNGS